MKNESIIATLAIVAIVCITIISFVSIVAIFCYKQKNIRFLGKHRNKADINGKIESHTEWNYDSTQEYSKVNDESIKASKKENGGKVSEADPSNSNL